jgi:hypothetical protein
MKIMDLLAEFKDMGKLYEVDKNRLIDLIDYRFKSKQIRSRTKINKEFEIQNIPYVINCGRSSDDLRYWLIEEI